MAAVAPPTSPIAIASATLDVDASKLPSSYTDSHQQAEPTTNVPTIELLPPPCNSAAIAQAPPDLKRLASQWAAVETAPSVVHTPLATITAQESASPVPAAAIGHPTSEVEVAPRHIAPAPRRRGRRSMQIANDTGSNEAEAIFANLNMSMNRPTKKHRACLPPPLMGAKEFTNDAPHPYRQPGSPILRPTSPILRPSSPVRVVRSPTRRVRGMSTPPAAFLTPHPASLFDANPLGFNRLANFHASRPEERNTVGDIFQEAEARQRAAVHAYAEHQLAALLHPNHAGLEHRQSSSAVTTPLSSPPASPAAERHNSSDQATASVLAPIPQPFGFPRLPMQLAAVGAYDPQ